VDRTSGKNSTDGTSRQTQLAGPTEATVDTLELEFWLREADGNVSLAARNMGLNRTHLYTLLARNGLPSDGAKRRA